MNWLGTTFQRSIVGFCCSVLYPGVVFAAPPPNPPWGEEMQWPALSTEKPTTLLMMGAFPVRFEATTLGDVVKAVGDGSIAESGQQAEHIRWLCYETADQRLWIISNSEMGGLRRAVTQIDVQLLVGEYSRDCPNLPTTFTPLAFDGSLWVGMPESQLLRKLGRPSHIEGAWRSFNFKGNVPGRCEPHGFDRLNWLWVRVENGRVMELRANQITSC